MHRDCAHCGAAYEPAKHNQRYCSKACNTLEHNGRRARIRAEKNGPTSKSKPCARSACGALFSQVHPAHKYCSESCQQKARSRRGTGLDPSSFGDLNRGTGQVSLMDRAAVLYADDPVDAYEFRCAAGASVSDTAALQVAVLSEAVSHVRGGAIARIYEKEKLRAEAVSWLRGEDDCPELGPYTARLCFAAAGLDQPSVLRALGLT